MTTKLILGSLCFLFLFSACQKDDPQPSNPDVLNASCESSKARLRLYKQLDFSENNNFGFTVMSGFAGFSDETINLQSQNQSAFDVGTVKVNGIALQKSSSNGNTAYFYMDTVSTASGQVTWDVEGGNGYPAFTHQTANSLPTFTVSFDKNTISTTEDLVINFNNLMEADSVEVRIGFDTHTTVAASTNSVTVTAAELSAMNLFPGYTTVNVIAFSKTTKNYGDREVCFTLESERRTGFTRQ